MDGDTNLDPDPPAERSAVREPEARPRHRVESLGTTGLLQRTAAIDPRGWKHRRKVAMVLVPLLVITSGFLVVDSLVYESSVSGGVEVGGLDIGGLQPPAASKALRAHARELASAPIRLTYEGQTYEATPAELGWEPNVPATVHRAMGVGREGLPWTRVMDRLRGLAGALRIDWVADFDDAATAAVLAEWEAQIGAAPREGSVRVVDGEVMTRMPRAGIGVQAAAVLELATEFVNGEDLGEARLPAGPSAPLTTAADVEEARRAAERAISGPITAQIRDTEITLEPDAFASLVRTTVIPASEDGPLVIGLAARGVGDLLERYRRRVEVPARDAEFLTGKKVRIRPSKPGRTIDPAVAAVGLFRIATRPSRTGRVGLAPLPPDFTTSEAEALGIQERLSTFTTYFPSGEPRVINIQTAAAEIDGTVLEPGEQFSMNELLGQRTLEDGYVMAPAIVDGKFEEQIGGGVSQLATTTFNAAFFAGFPFQEYQAHSFYFDRYPMGREATVSWTAPDLKFTNDTDDAVLIATDSSAVSVTVSAYGTNPGREVEATDPEIVSETKAGFTVLVERVVTDRKGDVIDRDTFRTYYKTLEEE